MRGSVGVLVALVVFAGCQSPNYDLRTRERRRATAEPARDSAMAKAATPSPDSVKTDAAKPEPSKAAVASAAKPTAVPARNAPHALPWNPFAKAESGERTVALVRLRYEGTPPPDANPQTTVWEWTAMSGTDTDRTLVYLEVFPQGEFAGADTKTWSKKTAPSAEEFLGGFDPAEVTRYSCEDAHRRACGRDFACKKITLVTAMEETVAYVSPDVPLNGLVALTRRSRIATSTTEVLELELAGAAGTDGAFGQSDAQAALKALHDEIK